MDEFFEEVAIWLRNKIFRELEENRMEKQAMDISPHCWTQRSKSQSTNIVLHIQTPRGRNTDLVLGVLSQT